MLVHPKWWWGLRPARWVMRWLDRFPKLTGQKVQLPLLGLRQQTQPVYRRLMAAVKPFLQK